MKTLTRLLAKLYPPRWRQRYGAEFDALLDDTNPGIKTALNVFSGAISMQIRTWSSGKILTTAGVAGVLVAIGIGLAMPKSYKSMSTVKIGTIGNSSQPDVVNALANEIESRQMLVHLIQTYGLYPGERSRMPLEDVIDEMKKNIIIVPIRIVSGTVQAFSVQFNYPDPVLAQKITNELTTMFINLDKQREAPAAPLALEILDPASPAQLLPAANILGLAFAGLVCGLLLGAILASRSWKIVAGTGLAGAVIAAGIAWFLPKQFESSAVVKIQTSSPQEAGPRIQTMATIIEGRESLTQVIDLLGLYSSKPGDRPPEAMLERMRHNIAIVPINGSAFAIRFHYSDQKLTQKVTQELAAKFIDLNFQQALSTPNPLTLQVLDPASFPANPVFPSIRNIAGLGLGGGILLGAILAFRFRLRPQVA